MNIPNGNAKNAEAGRICPRTSCFLDHLESGVENWNCKEETKEGKKRESGIGREEGCHDWWKEGFLHRPSG